VSVNRYFCLALRNRKANESLEGLRRAVRTEADSAPEMANISRGPIDALRQPLQQKPIALADYGDLVFGVVHPFPSLPTNLCVTQSASDDFNYAEKVQCTHAWRIVTRVAAVVAWEDGDGDARAYERQCPSMGYPAQQPR
jgi:hypothetical protein